MEKQIDMDKATQKIAEQVAESMAQLRREAAMNSKHMILLEALILLRDLGEDDIADALFEAKKRIGDKLKLSPEDKWGMKQV